ncbi:PAS domain S-box-containing protein [Microlunatus sagamiharensis]|uniref:Circadian input-output histidine kinase CikA n=1 Tax=Microlunatus sagamiharensis TaxID=546874 RepID=A0A1H2N0I5_9ACTN|nr:response regulator [Microlunatus sagamiharensis]SDU98661.1 PAS domain S-box-containing protein [Microlunatus sagamiharensis]
MTADRTVLALGDPLAVPSPLRDRRTAVLVQLVVLVVAMVAVAAYLHGGPPTSGSRLLVGNLALLVAMVFGVGCCVVAARRRAPGRAAWVLISLALCLGAAGQALFTSAVLQGAAPKPSPLTDTLAYLGYSLPLLVALFLFPRPPERLISRFRGVVDAVVITTGVLLVSEGTVLGVLRQAMDLSSPTGLATLAYPVADVAICAVVLTLGMRQAPADRLVWLCMGAGLLSLAVTDSVYVRELAAGTMGATGTPLVLGWVAAPLLIGLASQTAGLRTGRHRDLDLASQLIPYAPVIGAAVVVATRPVRDDPFLLVGAVVLLVTVAARQVMIVYENLTLTRDLERKVAERTAELATLGSIVTSSRDAVVGFGLDRSIIAWNPAAEELFGHPATETLGRDFGFLPEATRERVTRLLGAAVRREPLESYEAEWQRPSGSTIPVAFTVSPVLDGDEVVGISVSAQDITERRREAEVLEQAREEALQSARVKSEFLATMSHEIRTPMNGVIGLVSLLLDTELDQQQRDYAEGVHHAGQALLDVINDILDFSKLEAGKLVLDSDDFDLRRLVEEVGDLLAPAAYAKGLELLVDFDPTAVRSVRGDHVRVRQVLLNLASNAVKFTAAGEVQIKVGSTLADDGTADLHVEVVDTGIGIAEADQPRVFESFSQADASTTRRYGGTGLGLAICRRLVEAMGGEIGVRSVPGLGSTFWFDLRLPVVEAQPQQTGDHLAPGSLPSHLRALVVDDNATNRTILAAQLGAWGIAVDAVDSADGALAALRAARTEGRRHDLAILDMLMPDVDGMELARRIDRDDELTGLPMIMLSSAPRLPLPMLEEVGVARWLNKPVRAAALYDAIVRLVGRSAPRPVSPVEERGTGAAQPVAATATRGRVLVVEDNELNQLVACGLVERLGFSTAVAGNGLEALAALEAATYDAVLMDCHMPLMDGYAATRRIREREQGRSRTPVIALTAGAMVSDRERCLAAGMDDYIAKPIDPDALAVALDRWVPVAHGHDGSPGAAGGGPTLVEDLEAPSRACGRIDAEQIEGLAELRSRDGADLLTTFISSFTRRADDRLHAIRTSCGRADDEALAAAAHELKGSAATIGATRVASLCAELEHEGSRVLGRRPTVLDDLEVELRLAVDELDAIAAARAA